jgi:hypothetical protein
MIVHLVLFVITWALLLYFYGWNEDYPYVYRASASYWWYWINLYIHIRIEIKILLPLMNKHVREDKPGYLDPIVERFKAWLRERISYAGGRVIIS